MTSSGGAPDPERPWRHRAQRSGGIRVTASPPLAMNRQNASGVELPPGSRHAMPISAIGSLRARVIASSLDRVSCSAMSARLIVELSSTISGISVAMPPRVAAATRG